MKKKTLITAVLTFCAVLELVGFGLKTESLAYYDWGPVSVTLGETTVSMKKNETVTISAQVSPASDDQLPGCGMAQCPQQCGPDCVNEHGDCQCAGTTYQTYYASVKISSSDTTIANASYKAGVVRITGIAPGEAVIRVTGSLRQYSDTTKEIKVTVTDTSSSAVAATPASTQSTVAPVQNSDKTSSPTTGTPSVQTPTASSPTEELPSPTNGESGASADSTQNTCVPEDGTVGLQMGKYVQIELTDNETVYREAFAEIQGQDINKTFKKTDNSGNVLYSWTFNGLNITTPAAIDLTILNTAAAEGKIEKLVKQNKYAKIFSFAYSGVLPGKAEIYIRVSDTYQNGQLLSLFRYNPETKLLEPVADKIKVENGCAVFTLDHCSDYVLVPKNKNWWIVPVGIAAAVIAVAFIAFKLIARRKKRYAAWDGEDNT